MADIRRPEYGSDSAAAAPGSMPSPAAATIKVLDRDAGSGQAAQVRDAAIVIGRDGACDLVLTQAAVSRRHAEIRVVGDGFELEDLGSGNGTWLNDQRLTDAALIADGDRIRVADVNLTFSVPAEPITTDAPAQPPRRPDRQAGRPTEPPPKDDSRPEGSLARKVVASDGFSGNALGLAVLGSVVGTILTASLGTGRWGVLVAVAIGPVLAATFTTRKVGERGRVRLGAIVALSALALVITITGFALTPEEVKEPLVGDADPSATLAQVLPGTGQTTDPAPPSPSPSTVDPPPSPPSDMQAGANSTDASTPGAVKLTWTHDGEDIANFTVVRVEETGTSTELGPVDAAEREYVDSPLPGTYSYQVQATDSAQQPSALSAPDCVTVADGTVMDADC